MRNYFRTREIGTEKIPPESFGPETPVVATYAGKGRVNGMTDKVVAQVVRRLLKRAGIKGKRIKPHSLRKFFHVRLIAGGCPES